MSRPRRALAAALALHGVLVAQEVPPAAATRPAAPLLAFDSHDEPLSRQLFAACDQGGDDRLSIFEARRSVPSLEGDLEPFRAADQDADGFLSWPEFDRLFREVVRQGGVFRIRPQAPVAVDSTVPRPGASEHPEADRVLRMLDRNGSGDLDLPEFQPLVRSVNPTLDATAVFRTLDRNASGRLEVRELVELTRLLPGIGGTAAADLEAHDRLPAAWRPADRDRNGWVDAGELAAALERLHPGLRRWAARILKDADRAGTGRFGPEELRAFERPPAETQRR
ncbi:MAG: hypothetical protein IT458_03555 [Planctomycetes bacterium]|nr:hypothetical protein [Planctomycetota bacterium]